MATKIIVDAGHGGYDNGATYNNRREKDDNLKLALAVGKLLSQNGFDVEYTRTTDVYDSPIEKARKANALKGDYFLSIHRNSSPTNNYYNGVQTLIYDQSGIKKDIATSINKELEKVGYKNINVESRPNLAVLKRTQMPALLVEAGFINNDKDNKLFDERFDETAQAIADGIINVVGNPQTAASIDMEDEVYNNEANVCNGYQILAGVYNSVGAAIFEANNLKDNGYEPEIYKDGYLYQVRTGCFSTVDETIAKQKEMQEKGFSTLIVKSVDKTL